MRIEFHSTRVEFVSGENVTVQGCVSCKPGDKILLLGGNGVGKSTVLVLLHAAASRASTGGSGSVYGHVQTIDWDSVSVTGTKTLTSAYVFQEPRLNFICRASSDEVVLPFLDNTKPAEEIVEELEKLIDAADIYRSYIWRRPVDTLSSGEQQRIAVAAALAAQPTILLWDEALDRVDDASAQRLVELLDTYPQGIVMMATHRAERYTRLFGDKIKSTIHVTRDGNAITLNQNAPNGYNQQPINFAARPLWKDHVSPPPRVVRLFNNGMRLFSGTGRLLVELDHVEFTSKVSHFPIPSLRAGEIHEGLTFVVGRNGSGKTLLLQLLAGQIRLNPFFTGSSLIARASLPENKLGSLRALRNAGLSVFLPAEPFRWLTEASIAAELQLNHEGQELARRVRIMESCGLSIGGSPDNISYGQKKLLAVLSIPNRCELVCLDEPFADLSLEYIQILEEFISRQIKESKWTAVVISHSSDINVQDDV